MRPDNSRHLVVAAVDRSRAARTRAEAVLHDAKVGAPIVTSIAAFVRVAQVSRSWLYTSRTCSSDFVT